jgi:hypothetical protein
MTGAVVDTIALSRLWDERWPSCSKLPYDLREARDRWVVLSVRSGATCT